MRSPITTRGYGRARSASSTARSWSWASLGRWRQRAGRCWRWVTATAASPAKLVFFSSDHVFDGKKSGKYVESDAVNPLSVYAKHKREVEELLLRRGHTLICRTAWVFGAEARKKNFVYRVRSHALEGTELKVPSVQSVCPTWTGWLCESTLKLLGDGALLRFQDATAAVRAKLPFDPAKAIVPVATIARAPMLISACNCLLRNFSTRSLNEVRGVSISASLT